MTAAGDHRIVELRRYRLHPGARDVLIELFDRELVESQEAVGIDVIGQFRDLDDPDRFVWLRGFPDLESRRSALGSFYGGPVWKEHRDAANATMVDSDDVLLLRPPRAGSDFPATNARRPEPGLNDASGGLVVATTYSFDRPVDADFLDFFEGTLARAAEDAGASVLAYLVTESGPNTFPALPVREGENVFVWFSGFADREAYDRHVAALERSDRRCEVAEGLRRHIGEAPEVSRLAPTTRSLLRWPVS